jgi:SAM-dependent methyltransferase
MASTRRSVARSSPAEPEQLTPETVAARLIEGASVNRYLWAAPLCVGRRVLDAGCGLASGSAILAEGGAVEVVGVDTAAAVLEAAADRAPERVRLERADLRQLPFADGSFGAVVSFDVIDQVDNPEGAVGELTRVLADDGLLMLSWSNPDRAPGGETGRWSAHRTAELRSALEDRYRHVTLYRQAGWTVSAVLDESTFSGKAGTEAGDVAAHMLGGAAPGSEEHTIAIAAQGPIPMPRRSAVFAEPADFEHWRELWEKQRTVINKQLRRIDELEAAAGEVKEMRQRVVEAELALNSLYVRQFDEIREHIAKLELEVERMINSRTWRLTAPLRIGGTIAKRLRKA